MPGKPLSTQQIAALWRAYKIRQTANYVGTHCHISHNTAAKYIRDRNFAARYAKLQAKADELVDEDQAKSLARDLENITNIKSFIADALLDALKNKTFEPGTADYDRILRLERYLRGEPDSHIEQDFSFEWLDDDDDDDGDGDGEGADKSA